MSTNDNNTMKQTETLTRWFFVDNLDSYNVSAFTDISWKVYIDFKRAVWLGTLQDHTTEKNNIIISLDRFNKNLNKISTVFVSIP